MWLLLCFLASVLSDDSNVLTFRSPALFPESFDWDPVHEVYLVGSLTSPGFIRRVEQNGDISIAMNNADLKSTSGIHIDPDRNLIYVCSSDLSDDPTVPYGKIFAYDLATYDLVWSVTLDSAVTGSDVLCNDLVTDKDGNVYATNSLGPEIWKVSQYGTDLTMWATSDEWVVNFAAGELGLNGIAYNGDGYLIVNVLDRGTLWKVPITDEGGPGTLSQVNYGNYERVLLPDGLRFYNEYLLVVNASSLWVFKSDDDWNSIDEAIGAVGLNGTTAVTVVDDVPRVLQAHLSDLYAGLSRTEFEIVTIDEIDVHEDVTWAWVLLAFLLLFIVLLAGAIIYQVTKPKQQEYA